MSLKNWSTTAASNNSAPPNGAPENTTLLGDLNDIIRQVMADVRTLAASDTIASATTCDLGSKDATFLTVSGTTTITGLGTVSAGIYKFLTFSDALILTHHATSLILPGAVNIKTVAGDTALFLSLGSGNWKCMYTTALSATTSVSAFTNSWVDGGFGWIAAGYWKDSFGVVHLVGNIKSGSTGTVAFTLGSGYRPTGVLTFPWQNTNVADGGDIIIGSNGEVTPRGTLTAGAIVPLSGITFRTT